MTTDRVRVACPVAVVIMLPPLVPGHAARRRVTACVVLRTTTTFSGNNLLVFRCMRRLREVVTAAFAVAASEGSPSIGAHGELPAGDERGDLQDYGLACEPGGGERRPARRRAARLSGGSDDCPLSTAGDRGDRAGHRGCGRERPAVPAVHRHRRVPRRPGAERPADAAAARQPRGPVIGSGPR